MKWSKPATKHGDQRLRGKFLLLPKTIKHETRWLEHAKWMEWYCNNVYTGWIESEWMP